MGQVIKSNLRTPTDKNRYSREVVIAYHTILLLLANCGGYESSYDNIVIQLNNNPNRQFDFYPETIETAFQILEQRNMTVELVDGQENVFYKLANFEVPYE